MIIELNLDMDHLQHDLNLLSDGELGIPHVDHDVVVQLSNSSSGKRINVRAYSAEVSKTNRLQVTKVVLLDQNGETHDLTSTSDDTEDGKGKRLLTQSVRDELSNLNQMVISVDVPDADESPTLGATAVLSITEAEVTAHHEQGDEEIVITPGEHAPGTWHDGPPMEMEDASTSDMPHEGVVELGQTGAAIDRGYDLNSPEYTDGPDEPDGGTQSQGVVASAMETVSHAAHAAGEAAHTLGEKVGLVDKQDEPLTGSGDSDTDELTVSQPRRVVTDEQMDRYAFDHHSE